MTSSKSPALSLDLTLAQQALNRGDWAMAEAIGLALIEQDASAIAALELLGLLYCQTGQFEQAIAHYQAFLRHCPEVAIAHYNLGTAFAQLAQFEPAITHLQTAIALNPNHFLSDYNLGNAYQAQRQYAEAIVHYQRTVQLQPQHRPAWNNLGVCLQQTHQLTAAVRAFEQALALAPGYPLTLNNLGDSWRQLKQFERAIGYFEQAIARQPNYPEAYHNLGITYYEQGQVTQAAACYQQALHQRPDYAKAQFSYGILCLTVGDLPEGFRAYEARWRIGSLTLPPFNQPQWDGSDLTDKTILLHLEQGVGDTLQFIRYAPWVAQRGGRVIIHSPSSLLRLLPTVPGVAAVIPAGNPLPHFDCYIPLLSLPRRFETTLETIPANVPYLTAPPPTEAPLPIGDPHTLKVGIVWAGNPLNDHDRDRSFPLLTLLPLFTLTGVTFYSLQKDQETAWQSFQVQFGRAMVAPLINIALTLTDFAQTAATITQLDLVITVDTAVAHLAGALGKPVWILLGATPDWRWLRDRQDSPWYPTARLFRQVRSGDWANVIRRVRRALQGLIANHSEILYPTLNTMGSVNGNNAMMVQVQLAQQAIQIQDWATAEKIGQEILQQCPQQAETLELMGLLHCQTERFESAIAYYQAFLAICPEVATAHYNLGTALTKLNQSAAAIAHYQTAIVLDPDFYQCYYNLGNLYQAEGQLETAIACFQQVLAHHPQHRQAWNNLGICFKHQSQLEAAVDAFQQALALQPDHALTHNNLGDTLRQLKQFDQAVAHLQQAIALDPQMASGYRNLALALICQEQRSAAAVAYQQALTLNPEDPIIHDEMGDLWRQLGDPIAAREHLERSITLDPTRAETHYHLGLLEYEQGAFTLAAGAYQRSRQLRPDYAPAQFGDSVLKLLCGNFSEGFRDYEARWQSHDIERPSYPQPLWEGADLTSKTILIHAEQGFGDTLQFIRYAPLLTQRGAQVIVGCPPQLRRILTTATGIDHLISDGDPCPVFDYHLPLLSLPRVLGTTLETIPATVPYLSASSLTPPLLPTAARKIGIVWAGNPQNAHDRARSAKLTDFLPLLQLKQVEFYSLQKGKSEELQQVQADLGDIPLQDLADYLPDFADTAATIAGLDLVITVDTSVAHLAGAMAKPVWILLCTVPDWRWLLDREDSPWYPTARLFRQRQWGDWAEVIDRVITALTDWLKSDRITGVRENGERASWPNGETATRQENRQPAMGESDHLTKLASISHPIGVGIGFPIGGNLGWGVYGLNLALQLLQVPQVVPVPLLPAEGLHDLDPIARSRLTPRFHAAQQLQQLLQQHPQQILNADLFVLKALGNHLTKGEECRRIMGKRNIGVIFSEDTDFTAAEITQARQFDQIIAGSNWNAEILKRYGLTNVETIQQGIDPTLFHPAPRSGLLRDRFVIFSGGKLEYRKGQDLVIAAFRIFQQRHREALLVTAWHNHWVHTIGGIDLAGHVIGTPAVTAQGKLQITDWLVKNNIPADAVLDVGLVPHGLSASILRSADVALFPNRAEGGTNLVAMESLACGIPTILSSNTGHLDLLGNHCYPLTSQTTVAGHPHYRGTVGWGESDVEEIVAVLEAIYRDRAAAQNRGHLAATWMQSWTWERQTQRFLNRLADLL